MEVCGFDLVCTGWPRILVMGQNIMKIRFRSYTNSENNQKEQGNKTSYDRILPQLCFFQLVLPTNSRKQTTKTALQVNGGKNKLYATKSKKCLLRGFNSFIYYLRIAAQRLPNHSFQEKYRY
jgi:hypothetical protein